MAQRTFFVLHGLMNTTLSWGKWEGFTISCEATMKLGGIFQGLKGRGMLVRLAGKFDPYRCEVSQQCRIENTPPS